MIATVTFNPSLDEWVTLRALRTGELNRANGFARYPGGKGINVSRVVHELGGRTVAYGLAAGIDGRLLRDLMRSLHIHHVFVDVAGTTRNNYKIISDHPRQLTEINTPGPAISRADLASLKRLVLERRSLPRLLVLSGSLPPGAPATTYRAWIAQAKQSRVPVVLDASGAAFRAGLGAKPWLIKPNRNEAAECLGRSISTLNEAVAAAVALQRKGPEIVALSLAEEGALLVYGNPIQVWHARAPKIKVNSAVGAGDSLVGGLVTGWLQGRPLQEAFKLGVACGTATALTPGTELCHRKDVLRIEKQVRLRRLRFMR